MSTASGEDASNDIGFCRKTYLETVKQSPLFHKWEAAFQNKVF